MPQFDSKQAFTVLAQPSLKMLPEGIIDLLRHETYPIEPLVSLAMTETGCAETDDNTAALLSALAASYARWGWGDDALVSALQGRRAMTKDSIGESARMPFGETLSRELDKALNERLKIGKQGKGKWFFRVVSGVLELCFPRPRSIGASDSYPIASATRDDLSKAQKIVGETAVAKGLPTTAEARESFAKMAAQACSPTICGGWLNLGVFMVSAWEAARRELVRETGDEKAIPDMLPPDKESIIDSFGFMFDLGPFRLDRVAEINPRYIGKDHRAINMGPHPFMVGSKHVERSAELNGGVLDPNLAPCAHCGGDYKDHTHDRVLVVQLTRDATGKEAEKHLGQLDEVMKLNELDGFVFLDTPQQYRIKNEEVEDAAATGD